MNTVEEKAIIDNMSEHKYIIVVENNTVVYHSEDRRKKYRHYKGKDGQSHASIAKEHGVRIEDIIETGLILDGQVFLRYE